ncbi:FISUMP domain-containing protein [Fibrobacter sp.]|uniref:FISUMP domain-containing protein n=1 Tax=Fibrobacter sp. TaxID=35828 RepID=UPI00388EC594
MMKKKRLLVFFAALSVFLGACSSDNTSSANENEDYIQPSDKDKNSADLPGCTKNCDSLAVDVQDADSGSNDKNTQPEYTTSTMTDSRDGKTYKTVTIGSQTWMAENLAYKTEYSFEYDDTFFSSFESGLFYDWEDAATGGENNGDICPSGWHLPTKNEWQILINFAGGREAADVLKSENFWETENGVKKGIDKMGFTALPAGYKEGGQNYLQERLSLAAFWSSDGLDGGENYAYACMMASSTDKITMPTERIYSSLNVRCVKD